MRLPDELYRIVVEHVSQRGPEEALVPLFPVDRRISPAVLPPAVLADERERRATLRALALVSRQFAALAEPVILRRILVDSPESLAAFRQRLEASGRGEAVRTLIVRGCDVVRIRSRDVNQYWNVYCDWDEGCWEGKGADVDKMALRKRVRPVEDGIMTDLIASRR